MVIEVSNYILLRINPKHGVTCCVINIVEKTPTEERRTCLKRLKFFAGQMLIESLQAHNFIASMPCFICFGDNEAVIKLIITRRSPTMRHVSRNRKVALDWLFDRINLDRHKSRSNMFTPKTNSQTCWRNAISPVMNGIIIFVCSTLWTVDSTPTSHAYTRGIFLVRVAKGLTRLKCSGLQHFCARHLLKIIFTSLACHVSHAAWSTIHRTVTEHVDFLFTSVPFRLDFHCNSTVWPICWTVPSQVLSPTLRLKWAVPSRTGSLESTFDDLATTLDASEAGERSDLGRLASPLFPQERETSTIQIENVLEHPSLTYVLASWNR